ncbi:MAG TPA: hypothetical protein VFO39_12150 [Candidatus Sulfotelmatobacter sp.]|nr:hypothetical protein [Candidatus Sulfotelmatobacter sp.]
MFLRNKFVLAVVSVTVAALSGCGGGGGHFNRPIPPPTGAFSAANLKGTYTFSVTGSDNAGFPSAIVGMVQFNGAGGSNSVTGGTVDISDSFNGIFATGVVVTGGSYTLTPDGRGQATLNTRAGTIGLDFVLLDSSHAFVTEFDNSGTGSGTMDLQTAPTQTQLAGSYAFSLFGFDTSGNVLLTVGTFALDSTGTITAGTGVQDFNDNQTFSTHPLSGSIQVGNAGAPGTATLTTTSAFGALTFDVFPVDSTHLKIIENVNGAVMLSGDVLTQQGAAIPNIATTYAFTMAGGINAPIAVGGVFSIDGSGGVNSGFLDINSNGNVSTPPAFSGSYVASGIGGRTLFNLNSFQVATQFVAYPTTNAGLLMMESDDSGVMSGSALVQSNTSFAASQGYGMDLGAANLSNGGAVEEDDIAEFISTSSSFSGLIDFNDGGNLSFDRRLSGTFQSSSPAGRFTTTTSTNSFNGNFYTVDGSTVLYLDTDSNLVGTGILGVQNAAAGAAAMRPALVQHMPLVHIKK